MVTGSVQLALFGVAWSASSRATPPPRRASSGPSACNERAWGRHPGGRGGCSRLFSLVSDLLRS